MGIKGLRKGGQITNKIHKEETKVDELRIEAGSRAVKYEEKSRTRYINSSL